MGKSKDLATRTFNDDLAFDTSTLYVDSANDRVGVGTTSPSEKLHVDGHVRIDNSYVKLNRSATYDQQWQMGITHAGTSDYGSLYIFPTAGGESTAGVKFGVGNLSTYPFEIDASGRVTTPSQPAFITRHNSAETYSANTYIDGPWATNLNRGNHFNTSNGIFTAPVGGLYQLNLVQNNRYPDEDGNFQVHVNNSLYAGLQFDPSGTETYWFTHTLVGTLNLSANDTVRLYSGSSGAVVDNNSWNHWSMYLIG